MKDRKLWLLYLVLPGRYGRPLTSLVIFCLLFAAFYLGANPDNAVRIPALFFSTVIAYIIPMFSYITEKSREAVRALAPALDLTPEQLGARERALQSVPLAASFSYIAIGVLMGWIHLILMNGSVHLAMERMFSSNTYLLIVIGTLLVWVVMTTIVSTLIYQAARVAELGSKHLRVELLNVHELLPFGRISISSCLAIVGALALFPLIIFESGADLMEILPGAIATLVPMIVIFVTPVWPIHRQVGALKEAQLAQLNTEIVQYIGERQAAPAPLKADPALTSLLVFRREVQEVSTWPFDVSHVTKLGFYLFIPPLTWVAAALMENLVDAVL